MPFLAGDSRVSQIGTDGVQTPVFPFTESSRYGTVDTYGNMISSAGLYDSIYAFTGREWDPETGLSYFRARYYDPAIGRFIQEDPWDTINEYEYAENNPLLFVDPTGERASIKLKRKFPRIHRSLGIVEARILHMGKMCAGDRKKLLEDFRKFVYDPRFVTVDYAPKPGHPDALGWYDDDVAYLTPNLVDELKNANSPAHQRDIDVAAIIFHEFLHYELDHERISMPIETFPNRHKFIYPFQLDLFPDQSPVVPRE